MSSASCIIIPLVFLTFSTETAAKPWRCFQTQVITLDRFVTTSKPLSLCVFTLSRDTQLLHGYWSQLLQVPEQQWEKKQKTMRNWRKFNCIFLRPSGRKTLKHLRRGFDNFFFCINWLVSGQKMYHFWQSFQYLSCLSRTKYQSTQLLILDRSLNIPEYLLGFGLFEDLTRGSMVQLYLITALMMMLMMMMMM